LRTSGSTLPTIDAATNLLIQANGGTTYSAALSILAGNAGSSNIWFGDTDNEKAGGINYSHGTSPQVMKIKVDTTDIMYVDGYGRVGVNKSAAAGAMHAKAANDSHVAVIAEAKSGTQTADLFQARNSSGAVLTNVDKDGKIGSPTIEELKLLAYFRSN
jgi:hypothetical protein